MKRIAKRVLARAEYVLRRPFCRPLLCISAPLTDNLYFFKIIIFGMNIAAVPETLNMLKLVTSAAIFFHG
jgi:hypothetical protein